MGVHGYYWGLRELCRHEWIFTYLDISCDMLKVPAYHMIYQNMWKFTHLRNKILSLAVKWTSIWTSLTVNEGKTTFCLCNLPYHYNNIDSYILSTPTLNKAAVYNWRYLNNASFNMINIPLNGTRICRGTKIFQPLLKFDIYSYFASGNLFCVNRQGKAST